MVNIAQQIGDLTATARQAALDRESIMRRLDKIIDDSQRVRDEYGLLKARVEQLTVIEEAYLDRLMKLELLPSIVSNTANMVQTHQSMINIGKRWSFRITLFALIAAIVGIPLAVKISMAIIKLFGG